MRNDKTQKLVWAGLFTALTTVATMIKFVIPIPFLMSANGYLNAGDALVIISAFLLGPMYGAFAAGFGSALADIFQGYALYAPATLIIKALMALTAGAILRKLKGNKPIFPAVLGGVTAEIIMISGYFAYELVVFGLAGAIPDIFPNCLQGVFGVVAGTILFYALLRIPYVKKTF